MHKHDGSDGIFEAPGPIIPTYRPTSQSSKRADYTMPALAPKHQQYLSMADDIHSTGPTGAPPSNENVTEIVRFLQTHGSSQVTPQMSGPKDMIKAGQRRLRLALRNKKGTDMKIKADNASRQLAALQQQDFFPISEYGKWGHKRNVPSVESSSKSVSNISFKSNLSNSKRDVEVIGQPWLESPLECRDAPGSKASSQLSSLDLHDLASFVEATVSFSQVDDSNPPPYQPSTEHPEPAATVTSTAEYPPLLDAPLEPIIKASGSNMADMGRKTCNEFPIASRFNHSAQPMVSNDSQNLGIQPLELKPRNTSAVTTKPFPASSSAPATPILKLFPDAISPRTSSKKALRVPTGRSPTPDRSLSPSLGSQSTTALHAVFESNKLGPRASFNSLPETRENTPITRANRLPNSPGPEQPSANAMRRFEPDETQTKHIRRRSSLPPGAIDAFPIPAPSRSLPSVPEPNPRSHGDTNQESSMNSQSVHLNLKRPDPETPGSIQPDISVSSPSISGNSNGPSRGRDSPFPRLVTGPRDPETTNNMLPVQPRRGSLGKAGRSREAKVRSLIMKDLAAIRHQQISSKDQIIKTQQSQAREDQLSQPRWDDNPRLRAQRHYQRKISPAPSSPPPRSLPSNPPQHILQRRNCTYPASMVASAIENPDNLSRPSSNKELRLYRQNNLQNVKTKSGRQSLERSSPLELETPLPSSDDEGPAGAFYWDPPRKTAGRRRRGKPTPTIFDEPTLERGRPLKQHRVTGSIDPPAQQNYRRRGRENVPGKHHTPTDYQPHEPRRYHAPEHKSNLSLESRIEHLERQNKILQAALLAAFDLGGKQDPSSLLGSSTTWTITPPLTERSSSSTTSTSTSEAPSVGHDGRTRDRKVPYRRENWIATPDSFDKSRYDSDRGNEAKDLEELMDEFNLGWLSDQWSIMS
ncbi:hypothetical protein BDW62DRAFT_26659 [Aspergillus aurantiobrunneus]